MSKETLVEIKFYFVYILNNTWNKIFSLAYFNEYYIPIRYLNINDHISCQSYIFL